MRIAHVLPHYYPRPGGAQALVRAISKRLAAQGHDVWILTPRWPANGRQGVDDAESSGGARVLRLSPRPLKVVRTLSRLPGGYRLLHRVLGPDRTSLVLDEDAWLPTVLFHLVRLKPDVATVVNFGVPATAYSVVLARIALRFPLAAIPLFHTEHQWASSSVSTRLLDAADCVLVLTAHEEQFVRRSSRTREVHVIGVGVDPDIFAHRDGPSIRRRLGLGDRPVVGYVGRLDESKGVGLLIRAMHLVWDHRSDVHLLLAGDRPDQLQKPPLKRAMAELPPDFLARVSHLPHFPEHEKASIFDALDIFAMPSPAESFGIAYLEAWMCAKPVVGANIPATACVISHERDGLLVDPHRPDELASALLRLLDDPQLRNRLGQAGRQKTLQSYTWDLVAERVLRAYRAATRGRSTAATAVRTRP